MPNTSGILPSVAERLHTLERGGTQAAASAAPPGCVRSGVNRNVCGYHVCGQAIRLTLTTTE